MLAATEIASGIYVYLGICSSVHMMQPNYDFCDACYNIHNSENRAHAYMVNLSTFCLVTVKQQNNTTNMEHTCLLKPVVERR